ncbi:cell division control protein 31 [Lipomyces tetrasporus]|uniref:Cell division control protein 31 n=1 Tax=Lipomyces tetrasporus TaxID=54092 RepID=A0AAD7QXA9_9ASCO|nr:cell division control protein 31 [Lipomyces tetrasporus]KAJ8101552.1 cell division control protein 31 [Lipomyces tetrasporus]
MYSATSGINHVSKLAARRRNLSPPASSRTNATAKPRKDLTEEQRHEIEEAFRLFDMDGDGKIDYHELKVAMRALGFESKKSEVLDILRENERSDPGFMSYDAFLRVMSEKIVARDPIEEIKRAFALFDEDQTGKISLRDLRKIAKELNENLEEDELEAMINEFDLDGDGEINLDEFIAICSDH